MQVIELVVYGWLLHWIADWFFQNDWQATNKAKRWSTGQFWWIRHPAAYVHAGIHTVIQLVIFPWWACLIIGFLHLIIDTRSPLVWWGKFTRQTRPTNKTFVMTIDGEEVASTPLPAAIMDIGMEVAFWRDQVAHLTVIVLVAQLCG